MLDITSRRIYLRPPSACSCGPDGSHHPHSLILSPYWFSCFALQSLMHPPQIACLLGPCTFQIPYLSLFSAFTFLVNLLLPPAPQSLLPSMMRCVPLPLLALPYLPYITPRCCSLQTCRFLQSRARQTC